MDLKRVARAVPDRASDPVLLDAIRAEITGSGPMTFARFMEVALYDPERGYYRGAVPRPGRDGDFLTAPEADPIFGRTLARFALAVHATLGRPPTLTIRESGAGTGALAAPLVEAVLAAPDGPGAIRYLVDEIEPARVEAVCARVREAMGSARDRVTVDADHGAPIIGLAIANEVLDALPTHRLVQRGDDLYEVFVDVDPDGGLRDLEAPPSTPALAERLAAEGVRLTDGQRTEVCLALDGWVATAARGLERGALLLIDYGHPAAELHDGRLRPAGTLATYRGHTFGDDPYAAIGRQDLTAHVDLTAVDRAARAAGLDRVGEASQADFLAKLGIGELLVAEQTRPGASLAGYLATRSAVVRLIDPAAIGGFRVVAFGRGLAADGPWPMFG